MISNFIQAYSGGLFSLLTVRDIGILLCPSTSMMENQILHLLAMMGAMGPGEEANRSETINRVFKKISYVGDYKVIHVLLIANLLISFSAVYESAGIVSIHSRSSRT